MGGALLLGADVSLTTRRGWGALHALRSSAAVSTPRVSACLLGSLAVLKCDSQACVETLGAGSLGVGRQAPPCRGNGRQTPHSPLLLESGCRCFRIHQTPHALKRTHRGKNGF